MKYSPAHSAQNNPQQSRMICVFLLGIVLKIPNPGSFEKDKAVRQSVHEFLSLMKSLTNTGELPFSEMTELKKRFGNPCGSESCDAHLSVPGDFRLSLYFTAVPETLLTVRF